MFTAGDELLRPSHEYSEDDDDDCTDDDEAYLDHIATTNYEKAAKARTEDQAEQGRVLTYDLRGIDIPITVRNDSEAVRIDRERHAKMEAESPFPPTIVETVTIDHIMITPLSTGTTIAASDEAIAVLRQHNACKKNDKKGEKTRPNRTLSSGTITPFTRPPPGTPSEHAALSYTLSTPHLPFLHPYTDEALLKQYQVERAKEPISFDLQTDRIKMYLLGAKIERGGASHLEENEYSVDLASREDAMKVQRMSIQRPRGMPETESALKIGLREALVEQPPEIAAASATHNSPHATKKASRSPPLPEDFDFASHVAKYTTTGSVRHQHSRTVREDETGSKTTLKTWIEITQEITVPNAAQLGWKDVKAAVKGAEAAKKEAETKERKAKEQQDRDGEAIETEAGKGEQKSAGAEGLLAAIARIKGTGRLTRGVTLSQYLEEIKRDIKQAQKDGLEEAEEEEAEEYEDAGD